MSDPVAPRPADSRLGHTTGVVLCGPPVGDVHALRVGASSLGERTAALLAEICEHVIWLGAAPPPGSPGREARGMSPAPSDRSSLNAALAAALDAAETDSVLVLSADRPYLSPDLAIGVAGLPDAPAAMPRNAAGPHPTCARYRRSLAGAFREAALAGVDSPLAVLDDDQVRWLDGALLTTLDPDGRALTRVDDAQGLARLADSVSGSDAGAWPGHPGLGLMRRAATSGST